MTAAPPRVVGRVGAVALFVVVPRVAAAASVATDVECPRLAPSSVDAFEARARIDLALRARRDGTVAVLCDGDQARVVWRPGGEPESSRDVSLPADDIAAVDALLMAAAELAEREPPAPTVAPTEGARAAPGAPGASKPERNVRADIAESAAPSASSTRGPVRLAFGGSTELGWRGFAGAVGPRLELTVPLTSTWELGASLGVRAGLEASQGVRTLAADGALLATWRLGAHLALALGASASALRFAPATSDTTPATRTTSLLGGIARATWSIPLGPVQVAIGPEAHAYPQPISVQVGGAEVARIPAVTAGVVALVELPLAR